MKFTLITVLLFQLVSCSSRERIKSDHLVPGSCEKEFNSAQLGPGKAIWENVTHASGTSASYLVTGMGYSTDFVISFTGGILAGIVICSPAILAGWSGNPSGSQGCFGSTEMAFDVAKEVNPHLGDRTHEGTKRWRCPNVDPIAQGLMKVANCYRDQGDSGKYEEQLSRIESSVVFKQCLSSRLKKKISSLLDETVADK